MMRAVLAAVALAIAFPAAAQAPSDSAPADSASAARDAQPTTVSPATAVAPKAKAADDPNRLVCKSEPVLGSRLAVKRCTTAGEAAVNRIEQRQQLERMQGSTYQH